MDPDGDGFDVMRPGLWVPSGAFISEGFAGPGIGRDQKGKGMSGVLRDELEAQTALAAREERLRVLCLEGQLSVKTLQQREKLASLEKEREEHLAQIAQLTQQLQRADLSSAEATRAAAKTEAMLRRALHEKDAVLNNLRQEAQRHKAAAAASLARADALLAERQEASAEVQRLSAANLSLSNQVRQMACMCSPQSTMQVVVKKRRDMETYTSCLANCIHAPLACWQHVPWIPGKSKGGPTNSKMCVRVCLPLSASHRHNHHPTHAPPHPLSLMSCPTHS